MTQTAVSVIVVSRNRPDALRLCLLALKFQFYEAFEIVVVADRAGLDAIADLSFVEPEKCIHCDAANISIARNLGIEQAGGELIAFIDDDAIAEPTWLEFLVAPFENPRVGATGGFVRGRNGINFQWTAEALQPDGTPIDLDISKTTIFHPAKAGAIKTQGTNCAFRRSALLDLDGFDPAFTFFLDETDLNWRLWKAGIATVIVPEAQVQHRYLGNDNRTQSRAIKSLGQIGTSVGYFRKKHGLPDSFQNYHRNLQRRRCIAQMRDGLLEPRDVSLRLAEFDSAVTAVQTLEHPAQVSSKNAPGFLPINRACTPKNSVHLLCRRSHQSATFAEAARLADTGTPVTVFSFSATALFHHCWFHEGGFWVQSGGQFGKSDRASTVFRTYRLRERHEKELNRLERFRRFLPFHDQ